MTEVCICRTIAPSGWDKVQHVVDPACPLHATYTAAEVKVLTEKAGEFGYQLGRKEALDQVQPNYDALREELDRWTRAVESARLQGRKEALIEAIEAIEGLRFPAANGGQARGWNSALRNAADRIRFIAKADPQPSPDATSRRTDSGDPK